MKALRMEEENAQWQHARIAIDPFPSKFWPFNPSILRTPDGRWLAAVRCANYHMPGSRPQVSNRSAYIINRNVMIELDEKAIFSGAQMIVPSRVVEITDRTGMKPERASVIGFEDIRLMWTGAGGLCAVGNAMQLNKRGQIEMCALAFDGEYQITRAVALRGAWSQSHQKNWMPYLGTDHPRLLYSVGEGGVHNLGGRAVAMHADVMVGGVDSPAPHVEPVGPAEVSGVGGTGIKLYSRGPRPDGMGFVEYKLRGGTQLVRIDDLSPQLALESQDWKARGGLWLGLAHGCRTGTAKLYWHAWILVDGQGVAIARSSSFKLATRVGIEFAAGLALDPSSGRLAVSYGVEDETSWIGTIDLEHVLQQVTIVLPTPEEAAVLKKERDEMSKHLPTWRGGQGAGRVVLDSGGVRVSSPSATSVMRGAPRAPRAPATVAAPPPPVVQEIEDLLAAARDVERLRRQGNELELAAAWEVLRKQLVAYGDTIYDEKGAPR